MICDDKPQTLKEALDVYIKELESEDSEELKQGMKEECHYVIEPELHTHILQMLQETILLTESSCRKHSIILNKVILSLQICLQILICIPTVWEQEIRSRVIQLQV